MPSTGYAGTTVTLTSANTKYKLLTLLNAVSGYVDIQRFGVLTIQNSPDNAVNTLSVGDVNLSTTTRGEQVLLGQSSIMQNPVPDRPSSFVDGIYLMSTIANALVNIGGIPN